MPFPEVRDLGVFLVGRERPRIKAFVQQAPAFLLPLAVNGGERASLGKLAVFIFSDVLSDLQKSPLPPDGSWEGGLVKGALALVSESRGFGPQAWSLIMRAGTRAQLSACSLLVSRETGR